MARAALDLHGAAAGRLRRYRCAASRGRSRRCGSTGAGTRARRSPRYCTAEAGMIFGAGGGAGGAAARPRTGGGRRRTVAARLGRRRAARRTAPARARRRGDQPAAALQLRRGAAAAAAGAAPASAARRRDQVDEHRRRFGDALAHLANLQQPPDAGDVRGQDRTDHHAALRRRQAVVALAAPRQRRRHERGARRRPARRRGRGKRSVMQGERLAGHGSRGRAGHCIIECERFLLLFCGAGERSPIVDPAIAEAARPRVGTILRAMKIAAHWLLLAAALLLVANIYPGVVIASRLGADRCLGARPAERAAAAESLVLLTLPVAFMLTLGLLSTSSTP